jgi:hypothetical protein
VDLVFQPVAIPPPFRLKPPFEEKFVCLLGQPHPRGHNDSSEARLQETFWLGDIGPDLCKEGRKTIGSNLNFQHHVVRSQVRE